MWWSDLTITSLSYDGWTGRGTVGVANIGGLDAGYFYTMAFMKPDTTATYPPVLPVCLGRRWS